MTANSTTIIATSSPSATATSESSHAGSFEDEPLSDDEVYVNDSLAQKTIPCDDKSVVINGSLNQVTFTGTCATVLTNGSLNHIAFDRVGSIEINGAKNQVTWQVGTDHAAPDVNDRGFGNQVNQG